VLHFAPEPELTRRFRTFENLRVVSADIASPFADMRCDITRIPLADECFDAVICSHVLEHVPRDRLALSELHRILRRGGWLLIQVPLPSGQLITNEDPMLTDPKARASRFGQLDHCRLYGMDLVDRVTAVGFVVETFLASDLFELDECVRLRLRADEPLFVARRP
jgi:SAM-dependent methyltransferase